MRHSYVKSSGSPSNGATAAPSWPEAGLEGVTACPVCGALEREVLHDGLTDRVFRCAPGVWTLFRCGECGVAYLNPRPTRDTIFMAYRSYYTHGAPDSPPDMANMRFGRLRLAIRNGYFNRRFGYRLGPSTWIGRFMPFGTPLRAATEAYSVRQLTWPGRDDPRLLDVGCGNGRFLVLMRSIGWHVAGLDPDSAAVEAASSVGLDVRHGTLDDDLFPDASFDAVTLSHVIEHMHDPVSNLAACFRMLRPGGALWIGTPNIRGPGSKRFGTDWIGLDPPRHLVLFHHDVLADCLERVGFIVDRRAVPSPRAEFYRSGSTAVAKGLDPLSSPLLEPAARLRAMLADLGSLILPSRTDELVIVAHRPE